MTRRQITTLLAATLFTAVAAADTILEVTPLTGRETYLVGETVQITVRACNPLDVWHTEVMGCSICVDHGCFCCAYLNIVDSSGAEVAFLDVPPMGCPAMYIDYVFAPGECKEVYSAWQQLEGGYPVYFPHQPGDQVPPGIYTLRLEWTPDDPIVESAPFEISALLFADGFEGGDTSSWDVTQPEG